MSCQWLACGGSPAPAEWRGPLPTSSPPLVSAAKRLCRLPFSSSGGRLGRLENSIRAGTVGSSSEPQQFENLSWDDVCASLAWPAHANNTLQYTSDGYLYDSLAGVETQDIIAAAVGLPSAAACSRLSAFLTKISMINSTIPRFPQIDLTWIPLLVILMPTLRALV